MPAKRDLYGKRFGRLTVVKEADRANDGKVKWECLCDCTQRVTVVGCHLTNGTTTSCGCYRSEYVARKNYRHGGASREAPLPEYEVWSGIIKRCTDEHHDGYVNYGGRGIVMCDRWRESFAAFLQDMGHRPSPQYSIERVNNDGPYTPSNCVWATLDVQANNKRRSIRVTIEGQQLTAKQAWRKYGQGRISYLCLVERLRRGMSITEALAQPAQLQLTYDGVTASGHKIWERFCTSGIAYKSFLNRLKLGYSMKAALTAPLYAKKHA